MTGRRLALFALSALFALVFAACGGSEEAGESPRAAYNRGLERLEAKEWTGARDAFLAARDGSGTDAELRYRSAYNLGHTYAGEADAVADSDTARAVELLGQAAAWFRDAAELRPEDDDSRANLEVVLRRRHVLADKLTGDRGLARRLERVLADERTLRDQMRALHAEVAAAGSVAEPTAFADAFRALATTQRTIRGGAGAVWDLAAAEIANLSAKPEEERTDADRGKLAQLEVVLSHVDRARQAMETARRSLRKLDATRAHGDSDVAVDSLKRALEQLMEPTAILRILVADQSMVARHTGALGAVRARSLTIGDDGELPEVPAWLTDAHLGERQGRLIDRTDELAGRLGALAGGAGGEGDPEMQRLVAGAKEAAPIVAAAVEAMRGAGTALSTGNLEDAQKKQAEAIAALLRALERFADIRTLIELAYADQHQVVTLLTPPDAAELPPGAAEALAELSTEKRAELVSGKVLSNVDRIAKLKTLFAQELASAEAAAKQQAGDAGQGGDAAENPAAEQFRAAEVIRAQVAEALTTLQAGLEKNAAPDSILDSAVTARERLEELRRLFFSIVEHLKELHARQSDTHDDTASAHDASLEEREETLGPLAERQRGHAGLGDALAQALEAQADQAAQAGEEQAESAEKLTAAAAEVRSAGQEMTAAAGTLGEAASEQAGMSIELSPVLDAQRKAMSHLEEAIRLLQPPDQQQNEQDEQQQQNEQNEQQQDQQQDQQQQQQDQQQQQGQGQRQEQQLSQEQADRKLQEIRDREAARRRDRNERRPREPVEKDW